MRSEVGDVGTLNELEVDRRFSQAKKLYIVQGFSLLLFFRPFLSLNSQHPVRKPATNTHHVGDR